VRRCCNIKIYSGSRKCSGWARRGPRAFVRRFLLSSRSKMFSDISVFSRRCPSASCIHIQAHAPHTKTIVLHKAARVGVDVSLPTQGCTILTIWALCVRLDYTYMGS